MGGLIVTLPPTKSEDGFGSPAGGERAASLLQANPVNDAQADRVAYGVSGKVQKNAITSEAGSRSPLAGEPNSSSDLVGGKA
jgi:hypothetical protein